VHDRQLLRLSWAMTLWRSILKTWFAKLLKNLRFLHNSWFSAYCCQFLQSWIVAAAPWSPLFSFHVRRVWSITAVILSFVPKGLQPACKKVGREWGRELQRERTAASMHNVVVHLVHLLPMTFELAGYRQWPPILCPMLSRPTIYTWRMYTRSSFL